MILIGGWLATYDTGASFFYQRAPKFPTTTKSRISRLIF
jgi:hypothetical protein